MNASDFKFKNAALLNRLSEMQQAPYYATACHTLVQAESAIVQLERENAAFLAELDAAKQDAGRLDWMEKNDGAWYQSVASPGLVHTCGAVRMWTSAPKLRAAIDAAKGDTP